MSGSSEPIAAAGPEQTLTVDNLSTYFYMDDYVVKAVDDVSLFVKKGEILGLVGESGSGKSVTALSIMRLIRRPGRIVSGRIWFRGQDLKNLSHRAMRSIRGDGIAMVFQDPSTSLNPSLTIGAQISESLKYHRGMRKAEAWDRAEELLNMVDIPHPAERLKQYPHQLSGGMRQRVMIAIALSCDPELLIADEPTTALDVTIQSQILELIKDLRDKYGTSVILITHDIGVVAETTDNVAVMYCGKILAYGDTRTILTEPVHPYLSALVQAMPSLDSDVEILKAIPGLVPNLDSLPQGCHFSPRCSLANDQCRREMPELRRMGNCLTRCWLAPGPSS
ncbi:MAG: ABC transporter ATP-binding protein [Deltaproteobacteria bacterium]|nr:ABC transporter ATP-binding protein [Deltaproteobacteria bacterium]